MAQQVKMLAMRAWRPEPQIPGTHVKVGGEKGLHKVVLPSLPLYGGSCPKPMKTHLLCRTAGFTGSQSLWPL